MTTPAEALTALDAAVQGYVGTIQEAANEPPILVTGWVLVALGADTSDGLPVTLTANRSGQPCAVTLGLLGFGQLRTNQRIAAC